jgi:hypothetical protein
MKTNVLYFGDNLESQNNESQNISIGKLKRGASPSS